MLPWIRNLRRNVRSARGILGLIILAGVVSSAGAAGDPLGGGNSSGGQPGPAVSERQEVMQVDPGTLQCNGVVTFDDVPGGGAPGTNYDGIFESNGAQLAERFAGQTLSYNGDFDVLSGVPSGPLSLQVGAPNQNLSIYLYGTTNSQILTGLGPLGFPDYGAIGEGSFAVLFDYDQSEFGFDLVGGNDGTATVNFFRRDGSLIDTIIISGLADLSYAFRRNGGIRDIAGISIHNEDAAGIGFDNLCHDIQGVPGDPPVCDAGGPYFGSAGVPVQFDGSGSYDPDGLIVSYAWDFGDGSSGSGVSPMHTYAADGVYIVTLCVVDNDNNTSCCESGTPVIPTRDSSWGSLKATYR